jgi:hypothetical protein
LRGPSLSVPLARLPRRRERGTTGARLKGWRKPASRSIRPPTVRLRYIVYGLASVMLLGAACFTVLPAGAWKWLACENQGTEACRRQPLADAQFVVACVGIAPAILLVFDAVRRSRRALLWLGIGVADLHRLGRSARTRRVMRFEVGPLACPTAVSPRPSRRSFPWCGRS